jgi:hypothetical protein
MPAFGVDQVPVVVVNIFPNDVVPVILGSTVFTGLLKTITDGAVKTVVPPLTSSAVTDTRRYFPESLWVITYVAAFAPAIATHVVVVTASEHLRH